MSEDIRDKTFINRHDVANLNFITTSGSYAFRRHFRQGLRSHILEVLKREDLEKESTGTEVNGCRWYPKAKPLWVFRIFRSRLKTLDNALREINRVKNVEKYLAPDFLARSSEFIVDYAGPEGMDLMLCGFQRYIDGEIVDPWTILQSRTYLSTLFDHLRKERWRDNAAREQWISSAQRKAGVFIHQIKEMVLNTGYLPDLAGIGNLIIVHTGEIKLVDINNISKVAFDGRIQIDDRGYPVCDKSIEALSLLEEKMTDRTPNRSEPLYKKFLDPGRCRAVKRHEARFFQKKKHLGGYPALKP